MENYYLSLVCLSCLWLVSSCNVSTSRKQTDLMPTDSVGQITGREMPAQEVPTRLLHKLGELYGDNPPGVVGFSVESKDCPDFIGGVYINDWDTLVIQIRGDSAAVRKQLEEVLGSKEFIVEPAGAYTQKELTVIQNKLSERWDALMDAPVMQNVVSTGVGINDIEIRLMLNTPEKRKEFREKVMAEKASFILYNNSGGTVYYGGDYTITYEDTDGVWRELPMDRIVLSLAYGAENGEHKPITAFLYPQVHANLPGRYRFFLNVTLGDLQAGIDVPLMAEFTLSDDKQELAHATKTPIPEYILQGMSEQEYLIQKERELEQELETKVFTVVEQMPEFPDGGQPGMLAFLENAVSEEVRATGKEDRITLSFVVERDGSLSNIEILRSKGDKQLEDEAIRIIRKMPKWNPGKQRGKIVRTKYTIPVTFRKK